MNIITSILCCQKICLNKKIRTIFFNGVLMQIHALWGGERHRGDTESPKEADHTMHMRGCLLFFQKTRVPNI